MRAATLFSGIGAPEAARPDWRWLWSAEIEPFPCAVLVARHPSTVNLGDVTAHDFAARALAIGRPDVVVFGSPCQSFSVAGKRLGLDDPRGNLALVALAVVRRVRPRWLVFENVPGLLSSGGGDDFAAFLAAVQECGYLGCWRVLDARHWGLAQRRQRVFFVGCLGDWRGPAEVLSFAEGLRGYPEAGREAGQGIARPLAAGSPRGSGYRNDADTADNLIAFVDTESHSSGDNRDVAPTMKTGDCGRISVAYGGNDTRGPIEVATALNAHGGPHGRLDFESETFFVTREPVAFNWQSGGDFRPCCGPITTALQREQTPAVWQGGSNQDQVCSPDGVAPTLAFAGGTHAGHHQPKVVGVDFQNAAGVPIAGTQQAEPKGGACGFGVGIGAAIRRLTPVECERLMGFCDGYSAITYRGKEAADGNRYRALGNSMAVPVLHWLLTRIEAVDAALFADREAAA